MFSEACGGAARTSVYSTGEVVAFPVPSPQKDNLPGNYTYAGCLQWGIYLFGLKKIWELMFCDSEAQDSRILPWMLEWPLNMSATICMEQCAAFGYPAAGVEVNNLLPLYSIAYSWLGSCLVWYSMLYDSKFTWAVSNSILTLRCSLWWHHGCHKRQWYHWRRSWLQYPLPGWSLSSLWRWKSSQLLYVARRP